MINSLLYQLDLRARPGYSFLFTATDLMIRRSRLLAVGLKKIREICKKGSRAETQIKRRVKRKTKK
jgi:hypothetical protein